MIGSLSDSVVESLLVVKHSPLSYLKCHGGYCERVHVCQDLREKGDDALLSFCSHATTLTKIHTFLHMHLQAFQLNYDSNAMLHAAKYS